MTDTAARLLIALAVVATVAEPWVLAAGRPPTDMSLCDLLAHPLTSANLRVRVVGTLESGPESLALLGGPCSDGTRPRVWLEVAHQAEHFAFSRGWSAQRFVAASEAGELRGDGPRVEWDAPLPVAPFASDQGVALTDGTRVRVTGRYDYAGDGLLIRDDAGHFSLRTGYGHLNCCSSEIVVESIGEAEE